MNLLAVLTLRARPTCHQDCVFLCDSPEGLAMEGWVVGGCEPVVLLKGDHGLAVLWPPGRVSPSRL